jgi:hypothetical protein
MMISDSDIKPAEPPAMGGNLDPEATVRPVLEPGLPLCVDLDGTLVKSDTLVDSLLAMAKQRPADILRIPGWIARASRNSNAT